MTDGPRVKTTQTSFRIIEAVRDNRGAGVSELARKVGLSKSAVHKHVQTLIDIGYLVREDDAYYLSNRFLSLGNRARERLPLEPATNVVNDLAETTGHVTNLMAYENGHAVYSLRVEPEGADLGEPVTEGEVAPLHATAGGKAILAFFPKEKRTDILDSVGLPAHTKKTITDAQELERNLRSIRDQHIAFDREEFITGHQCVASPVIDQDGTPIAAVSVTGNIQQMSGKRLEEDVTGLVTSAAKSIETELLSQ